MHEFVITELLPGCPQWERCPVTVCPMGETKAPFDVKYLSQWTYQAYLTA